ncbi:MAG TPA: HAD family phosphatase [Ignavibacteriaceae bacterium]|nr:HAD family phosphatase [Ignavibacteriaceae bacterium]
MKNRKYSVIVFDLGNVLIPFDYMIAFNKLEKIEIGLGQRFLDQYKENYDFHRKFESGQVSEDEFLTTLSGFINNKVDRKTLIDAYSKIFVVNEDVAALLPELKKKYRLVLLSNTNIVHQKYGWKDYSFLNNFEKLILSHEVGACKPDAKIYRAVETYTQLPSEEHIFIDDIFEYGEGAKKLGWDAIQFKNYNQLVNELNKRDIF